MSEQYFTSLNGYKIKDEHAIRTYDSVSDMKADTKLKSGMYVKTKGYYSTNDNGNGEYIIVDDSSLVNNNGDIHSLNNGLYAKLIITDEINLKIFGAKLDGSTDDTQAVINAFNFANENNLKVVQKSGTLYMPTATIDNCPIINVDCDFTGLKIKFDENSDNETVMIIADPDTLSNNTIQEISLTNENISELSKSNTNPINFLENYKNHYVVFETDMNVGKRRYSNEDIYYSQGFEINDLQQLTPNNMYADISENASEVEMKYLPLSQKHITIKLPQINIDGNVNNNPMILVMRNNIDLLDCIITKTNYTNTTEWVQPLFRCRYCCNITVKNWVGENISNEPINTDITSYIIAFDKCFNVLYENNNLLKAHGCFVSYHTNFINFINNVCDRFDNHYGLFGNINITNNSFVSYPSIINLGFGNGQTNISNNNFYKYNENGKEYFEDCIYCRDDLGVMYSGKINIENTYIEAKSTTNDKYVTLLGYIPTKVETTTYPTFADYHIPEINIKNTKYNTNVFERNIRIYNNIYEDKTLILSPISITNISQNKNTSLLQLRTVDNTSNANIILEMEKINIISLSSNITVVAKNNCNITSNSSNTNLNLQTNGVNTISGIYNSIDNFGYLNSSGTIEVNTLNNYGRIDFSSLDIKNTAYISGRLKTSNLIIASGKDIHLVGCFIDISSSVSNNGTIYMAGCQMSGGTGGRFDNGTINGNGNWAGANSNIINTL